MESRLLLWRVFTLIMVTDCVPEFCGDGPPDLKYATFKALAYKMGTLLNCECKKGFRRSNGSAFMNCTGTSGHPFWKNPCQCIRTSPRNMEKQATPRPEEQKERKTTEMPSQMQPTDQLNLVGYCREPPPWEHEASERIYHFVVGQKVHYECAQGFRALQRGPATSTCRTSSGKIMWTQPQLKCINESDKESQASTDSPGNEVSYPLITTDTTTDFKKHTDVATTTEMFIFTTEYQIAVVACVLLLIGILLLSVLTWQWTWRKNRRTI
uniref:Interleukin-2 receptor subunit alpha n=1 Tax=Molossus molossus TaxID=27622 RepID=A0A7J8JU83_MOLMO|nr:interleukin 2 receptor subunit alpha [Molossus molossus]